MKQDTRGQTIWAKTFPTDGKKVRRLANRRILAKEVSYFEVIRIILLERVTIFIVVWWYEVQKWIFAGVNMDSTRYLLSLEDISAVT